MPRPDDTPILDAPNLLERTFAAGCTRIAVISLHPGAGARTVVQSIAAEFDRRGIRTGVTRAPRIPLDGHGVVDEASRIGLPEGTVVATTRSLVSDREGLQSLDDPADTPDPDGVGFFRLTQADDVPVYGPDDPTAMSAVMARLERSSGGLALVDGAWERRAFAAPEVAEGVILVVGSGYSGSPQRSAGALGYITETLRAQPCDDAAAEAWPVAASEGEAVVLDASGTTVERIRPDEGDPAALLAGFGDRAATVVLPRRLNDHFLGSLTRSSVRCTLVVRDPTRIRVAPIYFKAWLKAGAIRVVEPMHVLAVATNPVNTQGPDARARDFHGLIVKTVPGVPVHDVRLEAVGARRARVWKFW